MTAARPRIAILDDYQNVARGMADWTAVDAVAELVVFNDHVADQARLIERLQRFDAIVATRERTRFPAAVLASLPRLKLLVTAGMRNLAIDLGAATAHRVAVSGTDNVGYTTAELTWGLILALARKIPAEDGAMRAGRWQTTVGVSLHGKTLGVVGLGRLGSHVAKIGVSFGMKVVAWSQNLTAERCTAVGATLVDKARVLAESDFVTIHLVLSERTRGLIGARELASMKRGAFLVNTSRAPIVDQAALGAALRAGAIAGAGLDVFETEPLPADDPVLGWPNTVLTPHLGYVSDANYRLWFPQYAENILAWLADKPIRLLNPEVLAAPRTV